MNKKNEEQNGKIEKEKKRNRINIEYIIPLIM